MFVLPRGPLKIQGRQNSMPVNFFADAENSAEISYFLEVRKHKMPYPSYQHYVYMYFFYIITFFSLIKRKFFRGFIARAYYYFFFWSIDIK